jgi:hypothetical protein
MTKRDNTKHLSVLLYYNFKILNLINLLHIFYTIFMNIYKHPKNSSYVLICLKI